MIGSLLLMLLSPCHAETECRYAQIKKEALAITCEKFSDLILDEQIIVETDHKPLVPLLGAKVLDCLPPRILRLPLLLDRFTYEIQHVPGRVSVVHNRYPLQSTSTEGGVVRPRCWTINTFTLIIPGRR